MKKTIFNNEGLEYFTIEELCHSVTASSKGILNLPDEEQVANMRSLIINVLDPLRRKYGKPIHVSSGFRSMDLNNVIPGSSKTSDHMTGRAADITVYDTNENRKLFNLIRESGRFDQLIDENNMSWVHVGYRGGKSRRQVLKKTGKFYVKI